MILVRESETEGCTVYLMRRSSRSRFMPDAYVFPGGAVDASDRSAAALERLAGWTGLDGAFVVAALRETFEEAGVLLVCDAGGNPIRFTASGIEALHERRAALARGDVDFVRLLEEADWYLDGRAVHHYSNWITPASEPLRFDAHFFIARAPAEQRAAADAVEVHDGRWLGPQEALDAAGRGELSIMFPTRMHLERLARYRSLGALLEHARARRVVPIEPFADSGRREITMPAGLDEW